MEVAVATFADWLGKLLGHSEWEVQRLLDNQTAVQFLIVWSLFESKCFGGYLQEKSIREFADRSAAEADFPMQRIAPASHHFHDRYQNDEYLRNLLYGRQCPELRRILRKPLPDLARAEVLFLCVFVAYRFRNNIFHGNKGVDAWLKFEPQIRQCIEVMQVVVTHAEAKTPSMRIEAAA